jgi:multiple sugar transport system substrate-binding protein
VTLHLKGMAWDHPRGYEPMVATARVYEDAHPGTRISWEKRSLQAFEHFPIEQLADEYDLIVIDHPHIGVVAREGYLVALDELGPDGALETLAAQSIGRSHESYQYGGHQWALAIDAAAQVSAYRPDLSSEIPRRWSEVVDLAKTGRVLWPLTPVHALMAFFTLAANRGTPCAEDANQLISTADGRAVLEALGAVGKYIPPECLSMDPIEALDLMSTSDSYVYCPLVYGYSNYARDGFRERVIKFANIPSLGGDRPCGSTLGGTGIAVSAKSGMIEEAINYAFWIASADCQKGLYFEAGGQPANIEAWNDDTVNKASQNFFRDTQETLQQAWLRPRYDGYLSFQEEGGNIVNAFLANRTDVEETLKRLEGAYQDSVQ